MNDDVFSVSQLNTFIQDVIRAGFPQPVWVCGEVQGYDRQRNKNHIFFQLVEKDPQSHQQKATIDLVIWSGKKGHLKEVLTSAEEAFELRDDIEVKFLCRVDFYPPHGRVRLAVDTIDPYFTLGKLAQEKQKLIARLEKEGVLEKNKQLGLSPVPLRIGLITSDDSAAYNDFMDELKRSGFAFRVFVRNTLMQGKRSEKDVIKALDELKAQEKLDAVVITRGGGSLSDLSCFDSEAIAKKIAAYPVPVLCGIGHEINITITDLAAHSHAKTPTAVARFLVQRTEMYLEALEEMGQTVVQRSQEFVERERRRLHANAVSLQNGTNSFLKDHNFHLVRLTEKLKARPVELIKQQKGRLGQLQDLLIRSSRSRIQNECQKMNEYARTVKAYDPVNTLKRGFSITRTSEGKSLKDIQGLRTGDTVRTQLASGSFESQVTERK